MDARTLENNMNTEEGKVAGVAQQYDEDEYQKGFSDAWSVVKKIIEDVVDGGYSSDVLREIFGVSTIQTIFKHITPHEAIAKIKAYEDKQKQDGEIRVGDEVKIIGSNPVYDDCDYGVCTYVKKDKIYVMRKDGSASEEHKSGWKKTGRAIPQMAEVLKEMRGAESKNEQSSHFEGNLVDGVPSEKSERYNNI